jgi:hypothetical protein
MHSYIFNGCTFHVTMLNDTLKVICIQIGDAVPSHTSIPWNCIMQISNPVPSLQNDQPDSPCTPGLFVPFTYPPFLRTSFTNSSLTS